MFAWMFAMLVSASAVTCEEALAPPETVALRITQVKTPRKVQRRLVDLLRLDCLTWPRQRSLRLVEQVGSSLDWELTGRTELVVALLSNDPETEDRAYASVGLLPSHKLPRVPEKVATFLHYRAAVVACQTTSPGFGGDGTTSSAYMLLMGRQSVSMTDWKRSVKQLRLREIPHDTNIEGLWKGNVNRAGRLKADVARYNTALAARLGVTDAEWMPYFDGRAVEFFSVGLSVHQTIAEYWHRCSPGR